MRQLLHRNQKTDAFHIEAARIITGATKLRSTEKLFFELGWESLQSRRNKQKLVIFYKILHGLTLNYLSDLVPLVPVQEITSYSLRNSRHIQNYRANCNLFLDFFFPSIIRAWNSLPSEVQQASSEAVFKSSLNRDLHTPKYFNSGTRKGQILQARLRMGCSSLSSDLNRKHIVPSPPCQCGHFASAAHFFFNCPNYNEVRLRYLPVGPHIYTVNNLLFEMESLTEQENESLFVEVQDFIVKSGRFL